MRLIRRFYRSIIERDQLEPAPGRRRIARNRLQAGRMVRILQPGDDGLCCSHARRNLFLRQSSLAPGAAVAPTSA